MPPSGPPRPPPPASPRDGDDAFPRDPAWLFPWMAVTAFAALTPWIVRYTSIEIPVELAGVYGQWRWMDYFCEYKARFVIALGVVMAACLVARAVQRAHGDAPRPALPLRRPDDSLRHRSYGPLYVLMVLTVVSALRSPHPLTAWWGTPLRREGAVVLLAYAVAALFARATFRDPRAFRWFFRVVIASTVPLAVWGILQTHGVEPTNHAWADPWIISPDAANTTRGVPLTGSGLAPDLLAARPFTRLLRPPGGLPSASLFNYNYFGTFMALALSVAVTWGVASCVGKRGRDLARHALPTLLAAAMLLWALLASKNLGGSFGLLVGLLAALGVGFPVIRRGWKTPAGRRALAVAFAAGALVAAGVAFSPPGQGIRRHFAKTWAQFLDTGEPAPLPNNHARILDFRLRDGVLHLDTTRGPFAVRGRPGDPPVLAATGAGERPLALRWRSDAKRPAVRRAALHESGRPAGLTLTHDTTKNQLTLHGQQGRFTFKTDFRITAQGRLLLKYTALGETPDAEAAEAWEPWPNFRHFASARGYFWSRAAPLLPAAGWTGFGPDTIAHVFPHHDVLARQSVAHYDYIIHKIHNQYLHTVLTLGWAGALAFIVFFVGHFVRLAKALRRWWTRGADAGTHPAAARVYAHATLTAWVGGATYAGAVCWTDGTLHFSPLFWALTGVGWAAASRLNALLDRPPSPNQEKITP